MPSTAELQNTSLTFDEFLAFLDRHGQGRKWQLFDGKPVMMIGGTRRHSLISGNVYVALRPMARRRGCEAHINEMLVAGPGEERFATAPDVFVRCGPMSPLSRRVNDPVLVVEVLSPSTMADDRGYKFTRYTTIPSLEQILFVYADELRIENWTRGEPEWTLEVVERADASVQLPSLDDKLALAAIYADTEIAPQ
jgi:Uma2 family endonuclease